VTKQAFDALLLAAKALTNELPEVADFMPWPEDLRWAGIGHSDIPARTQVQNWQSEGVGSAADLHRAVQSAAPYADWARTYTEAEVGKHFLENYGYFELFGPTGHFQTTQARAYIAYWNGGLRYEWHHHEAEKLYVVVSGSGLFLSESDENALLIRDETRLHRSNQPHAMHLTHGPILTYVLWRGTGVDKPAKMGRAW
jgi:mannose-6-phosphate isomerase-like protein (cupin superfamily)